MATQLSRATIDASRAFLNDLFICGGIMPLERSKQKNRDYDAIYSTTNKNLRNNAKFICSSILERQVSVEIFKQIDNALEILSNYRYPTSLNKKYLDSYYCSELASFIANFCAENNLYWNDRLVTTYELTEIMEDTIFGPKIADFNCFLSQNVNSQNNTQSTTQTNTQAQSTAQAQQTTSAQNNTSNNVSYKNLGPLSGNVENLVGNPGQKIYLNSTAFFINSEIDPKSRIFITPIDYRTGKTRGQYKSKLVRCGKANYDSDCTMYWMSQNDATAFLDEIKQKKLDIIKKFPDLRVAKCKADTNGYFKVNSELGETLIKASRLNEEMLEALNNDETISAKPKSKNPNNVVMEFYDESDIVSFQNAMARD